MDDRSAQGQGTTAMTTTRDPAFVELREAYESGNLVVFVGAGVSAAAGLPSWGRLVELLLDRARGRGVDPGVLAEIEELAKARQYIDALSATKEALGPTEFGTVVEKHLDDRLADEPEVGKAIAALQGKLKAVLTTNIDHLLERAFAGRWPMLPKATGDIATRRGYILKLHGTLLDRSTWVFTRDDYDRAMYADPNLKSAFTALFHTHPILFVGYGLADDDFDALLGRVRTLAGGQPPRHFALVDEAGVKPWRKRKLEAAGVRLIPYENTDGKHREVIDILRELPAPEVPSTPQAPVQRAITVEYVLQLLTEAGFEDPVNRIDRQPHLAASEMNFLERLLRCSGMETRLVSHFRPGLMTGGGSGLVSDTQVNGLIGIPAPASDSFVVAFWVDQGIAQSPALSTLQSVVACAGGSIQLYSAGGAKGFVVAGIEVIRLRDALMPFLGEALHTHAKKCIDAWTDAREQHYVAGRARLPNGTILPVETALDTSSRRTLVLGDFGTGKSTHMAHHAALKANAYLTDPDECPAPVLLPLGGLKPDLAAILDRHLPGTAVEPFRLAVDIQMVHPLFDGLDELALDSGAASSALASLAGAFNDFSARAIITSRKVLFPTAGRMSEVLGAVPSLSVVELLELNPAEIREFVEKATPSQSEAERALQCIGEIHDLESLAQRPALLDLIVENRNKLTGEGMSAAKLYEMATEEWTGTREEKSVRFTLRFAFARSLARKLFGASRESATFKEITREVVDILDDDHVSIDDARFEVHTATFLAFDEAADRLRFAHRSFLEYFLAVDIAERLAAGHADALDLPPLTPEIVAFLFGIVGWSERRLALRTVLTAPYRPRVSENALVTLYYAARERVGEGQELGDALDEEIPFGAKLGGAKLDRMTLPWISLAGADLAKADLREAVLSFADLRGARLDGAAADHAVLDGARLDGARMAGADLFAASFVDAALADVRWEAASLQGSMFTSDAPRVLVVSGAATSPAPAYQGQLTPRRLGWSPDGRWLACAAGSVVQIRDALSGHVRVVLEGHTSAVNAVAFSPDGRALASASDDDTVRLWDTASGSPRLTLSGHQGVVSAVAFSPNGRTVASASHDRTIHLWDTASGSSRLTLSGHQNIVTSVVFSPDGCALASGSFDKTVRLWDTASGSLRLTLSGHRSFVYCVAFSLDGDAIASASDDKTIRLWNTASGTTGYTLSGHQGVVTSVAFSPDGGAVASASFDKTVRIWDVASGTPRLTLSGHQDFVRSVAFSPDGRALASASDDKTVRIWDVASGTPRLTLSGHQDFVRSVAFSPDGRALASASDDKTVRLWDIASGITRLTLSGHQAGVNAVAFSPDSRAFASASDDKTVRIWDTTSGAPRATLSGHQGFVTSVTFSPDGRALASTSTNKTVQLWDIASGASRLTVSGHQGVVWSVAFSPDGRALASASADGTVRLWDAASGTSRLTLSGHQGVVTAVAFSPDGRALASASDDKTVRLWDITSGTPRATLSGHQGVATSVAFTPDGRSLASASEDGTVRLWDAASGRCLAILHATSAGFVTIAAGTPFFVSGGDLPRLLHFVSGDRIMPAELWAPLFHRPDLVRDALALGGPPPLTLAAPGLDTYEACLEALQAERERRGLIRRRITKRVLPTG